jgi:hypothetical protein
LWFWRATGQKPICNHFWQYGQLCHPVSAGMLAEQ